VTKNIFARCEQIAKERGFELRIIFGPPIWVEFWQDVGENAQQRVCHATAETLFAALYKLILNALQEETDLCGCAKDTGETTPKA
jgi:hypothetical protein